MEGYLTLDLVDTDMRTGFLLFQRSVELPSALETATITAFCGCILAVGAKGFANVGKSRVGQEVWQLSRLGPERGRGLKGRNGREGRRIMGGNLIVRGYVL